MPRPGHDPRIARFGSFEYRYHNGHLEWRVPGGQWLEDPHRPEEYAALAALKDHPWIDGKEHAA